MTHREDVPVEALREALADVEGRKPTQRLSTAIAYKRGMTQTELAAWDGVQRRTISDWFTRFDGGAIAESVHGEDRPGRPRELTAAGREAPFEALRDETPEARP